MKKILLLLKLPPPTTGATLMNKHLSESKIFNSKFETKTIGVSYNNSIKEFGKLDYRKIFRFITFIFTITKALFNFRPDIIYFQISTVGAPFIRDCLIVFICKSFQKKIVYHLRTKGIKDLAERKKVYRILYKWAFKNTSTISLSERLTYDIEWIPNVKPFIVYNGIPVITNIPEIIKPDRFKILYLSHLMKSKGILDLIEGLTILNNHNKDFSCQIVGEEADINYQQLLQFIKKKGLEEKVSVCGPLYCQKKIEAFLSSHVFVFPTYFQHETWGGVVIEAMQLGIPVIASDEASLPLIVENNSTGFIVPKNSPIEIADRIEFLMNNRKVRLNMGKKAKEKFFDNYTFHHFEESMIKTIKKIEETI